MRHGALIVALVLLAGGCRRPAAPAAVPAGKPSPAGWQVRYNAAQALARRGSPNVSDPVVWEVLREMLDEEQQLRNFRTKLHDGREVPDETAARLTVIGTLKAVVELHRKNPKLDLSDLKEPIAKLTQSVNAPLSAEARQAQLSLSQ